MEALHDILSHVAPLQRFSLNKTPTFVRYQFTKVHQAHDYLPYTISLVLGSLSFPTRPSLLIVKESLSFHF